MFNRMYLALEENRLRDRFGGTVATAIIEVLNKETNEDDTTASDEDILSISKRLIEQNREAYEVLAK